MVGRLGDPLLAELVPDACCEAARIELGLRHFLQDAGFKAFTDTCRIRPPTKAGWMYDKFAVWTYTGGEPESEFTRYELLLVLAHEHRHLVRAALLGEHVNNFNPVDISIPAAVTGFPARSTVLHEAGLCAVTIRSTYSPGSTRAVPTTCGPSSHTRHGIVDLDPRKSDKCVQIQKSKLFPAKALGRPVPSSG
jgi:hypothetical protein